MQAVQAGHPRFVLVEGEAGIGKSSLLSRFTAAHPETCVLRASGNQAEMLLAWGLIDQLLSAAGAVTAAGASPAGAARWMDADAMAVGAHVVTALGDLQASDKVVVVVVDDLHWSDEPSARALLFALRRMRADRVLGLVSARPGELNRLGEGWSRFAAGDDRVTRLLLDGLSGQDLVAMAQALGAGELSGRAVAQLLDHTGGNALHCRALLEELGTDGLARADDDLPAPRELASVVAARLRALSEPAQGLVAAAAVLGRSRPLSAAAGRDDLGSARRHQLHQAAAILVSGPAALHHRVAATVGPDDTLAGDLEEAARQAAAAGTGAHAAAGGAPGPAGG